MPNQEIDRSNEIASVPPTVAFQLYRLLYQSHLAIRNLEARTEPVAPEEQDRVNTAFAHYASILALQGEFDQAASTIGRIKDGGIAGRAFLDAAYIAQQNPAHAARAPTLLSQARSQANLAFNPQDRSELFLDISGFERAYDLDPSATLTEHAGWLDFIDMWGSQSVTHRPAQYAILLRHELSKPVSDQDPQKIEDIIGRGIDFLSILDRIDARMGIPYAGLFFKEYASRFGVGKAIEKAGNFKVGWMTVTALIGTLEAASDQDDDTFLTAKNALTGYMQGKQYFFDESYHAVRALYHSSLPVVMRHPQALEMLDFGQQYLSGFETEDWPDHTMLKHLEDAYTTQALAEEINRLSSLQMHAQASRLTDYYVSQVTKLSGVVKQLDMEKTVQDGWRHIGEVAHILQIATHLGLPTRGKFRQLTSRVMKDNHWDSEITLTDLGRNLGQSGMFDLVWQAIEKIRDPELYQELLYTALDEGLAIDPALLTRSNITLSQLTKYLQNPRLDRRSIEAAGFASKLPSQQILTANDIPLPAKVSFLIGRAQQTKKPGESLNNTLALLQNDPTEANSGAVRAFIDGLIETQDYKVATTYLTRFLDYKRTDDYLHELPANKYAIDAVEGLMRLGNSKGVTLAAQLFANPQLEQTDPEGRLRLFNLLFDHGYWPSDLRKKLEKRSGGQINDKYINFLAYLIRAHGLTASVETIDAVEPKSSVATLDQMIDSLKSMLNYADRYEVSMHPSDLSRLLAADETGLQAYFMRHAGKYRYHGLPKYPFETYRELVGNAANIVVDANRLSVFERHLIKQGYSADLAEKITNTLVVGEYPFGRWWPYDQKASSEEFTVVSDIAYEERLAEQSLNELFHSQLYPYLVCRKNDLQPKTILEAQQLAVQQENYLMPARIVETHEMFSPGEPFSYDELIQFTYHKACNESNKKIPYKDFLKTWQSHFWRHFIAENRLGFLYDDPIFKGLVQNTTTIFEMLDKIRSRKPTTPPVEKTYKVSYVEKGTEFFRFIRAADAIPSCVNSDKTDNHIQYMLRRITDPTSFTVDIFDSESNTIIGNNEMRLGLNLKTGLLELFCVGLYSDGKNRSFVNAVVRFVEKSIAVPLRLGAVNISSKYGGMIEQPEGYSFVTNMKAQAFSPIIYPDGQEVTVRIDDIIANTDDQWSQPVTANAGFSFNGYRKELDWATIEVQPEGEALAAALFKRPENTQSQPLLHADSAATVVH